MKLRLLMETVVVLAVTVLFAGLIYAANGDLIVNGNLGVGTGAVPPAAKAEVNGNMKVNGTITNNGETVNGNLTVGGTIIAPSISVPNVIKKYYESPEQTITPGGSLMLAHGLGTEPKLIQVWLVCKTAEGGYSVGDKLPVEVTQIWWAGAYYQSGCSIVSNTTSLNIRFGSATYGKVWGIPNKSTGAAFEITNANWKAIFRAWAM